MSGFPEPTSESYFKEHKIDELYTEIQETYLVNNYPWVIGYSGGKDSTATVQAIWYALAKLPSSELSKPVFIISSDTLVETPVVIEQIDKTLALFQSASNDQGLPFQVKKVFPEIDDSFWVNLIGRGYPAPTKRFRWCTERLKINPANKFILETAERLGEVVMILGARKSESMSRAQVMKRRQQLPGTRLYNHSRLSRAYVYTPIEDFTADDVWVYLDLYPSPWGGDNQELVSLYKKSNLEGECPLVIDTTTPSCGNSRFGCWTCTVVSQDRSMQALVKHGEEWMEPLLEFREELAKTQIPEEKHKYREFKRRNGHMIVRQDGKMIPGPYKFTFRKKLLEDLLEMQELLRKDRNDSSITLIQELELHEIRRIWRAEESDWEDSLPEIYHKVTERDLDWAQDEGVKFSEAELVLLQELCNEYEVPTQLVTRLVDIERRMNGMSRRTGIYNEIHRLFSEEWSSADEVKARKLEEYAQELDLGL